jgi:hypothetical protein
VLVHEPRAHPPDPGTADVTYAITRSQLLPMLAGLLTVDPVSGDAGVIAGLRAYIDRVDPAFPVVEP